MVVGVVVQQEEGALSRAPVRVGQVLEEPLVVGEVVLVDSSVCKYHGHGTAEAGGWWLELETEGHPTATTAFTLKTLSIKTLC